MLSFAFGLLRGVAPLVGGFFTGGFSLVWSFLSAAWGTEIGRTIIIGVGAFIGGWILAFNHEHSVKVAAVEAATKSRDAEWSQTIAKANEASEARIREALDAASKVPSTPATPGELAKLCAADASCRSAVAPRRKLSVASRVVDSRRLPTNN